jgi:hypothetical protein
MTPFRSSAQSRLPATHESSINRDDRPFPGIDLSVAVAAFLLWLALSFN